MSRTHWITKLAAASLLIAAPAALAEDIDLFLAAGGDADPPNVVIFVDNSANWGAQIGGTTQEEMTRAALQRVFVESNTLLGQMRVGLMPFSSRNNPRGSQVIAHVRMLDEIYQQELALLIDENEDILGRTLEGTNNAPYAMAMHEAFLYFRGAAPFSGEFTSGGLPDPSEVDPLAFDDDGTYISPARGNCGKNFVIVIGNGEPDSGEDNIAESKLDELGGVLSGDPISLDPPNFESNWADEFARFMSTTDVVPDCIRQGDQDVTTFFIDVFNPDSNQVNTRSFQSARAWARSVARWGDGRYFPAHSTDDIANAIEEILLQLMAINSVFASATLPVSVNVRGINLNQVYMGQFRPDAQNRPRWLGNLKLYQLALDDDTGTLFLADKDGEPAESSTTGFITSGATSFWTSPSSFWEFEPRGNPPTGSDAPDGEVVEKGAAAQRLREAHDTAAKIDERQVFTCTGACLDGGRLAESPFHTSNADITAADLGVASSEERAELIDWMRGHNNVDPANSEDDDTKSDSPVRPSIHGDVLHSRPAVVNLGENDDDDVFVFYGANDGKLHAIKGGKEEGDGEPLWSFVPEEFFGDLKALRDNDELGKRYYTDGSIGVMQQQAGVNGAEEDRIWIFVAMRRGGRFMYALDVTNPLDPRLLWRRSHSDPGFEELGQTWSLPVATRIRNQNEEIVPVVIFGAGYDAEAEDQGVGDQARSMGRGIFVVHAETGEPIWQAGPEPSSSGIDKTVPGMQFSIAADLAVLDRNRNGRADRIYAADTGGNIWRVDIHDDDPGNWAVNHLAEFGSDQKFLFRVDVVLAEPPLDFDSVLIGSGNREDPFDRSVTNHFYMIKDVPHLDGIGDTRFTRADLFDATDNAIQEGDETQRQAAAQSLEEADGWFVELEGLGEKTVSNATTLNRATFFNTNEPPPPPGEENICVSDLGVARTYIVDFADARAIRGSDELTKDDRATIMTGGGFPPAPVPVVVEIDGEQHELVLIGPRAMDAAGAPLGQRQRVFWSKEFEP